MRIFKTLAQCSLLMSVIAVAPAGVPAVHNPLAAGSAAAEPHVSERVLDNLVAYTRLLGYVRYFHPSDAVAATDWDTFAVRTIQSVENAPNADILAAQLQHLFVPYGPTIQVFPTSGSPPAILSAETMPGGPATSIVQWRHTLFGSTLPADAGNPPSEQVRARIDGGPLPAGFHDPHVPYVADLGGGVTARIPLSLYADDAGTLPHASVPALPPSVGATVRGMWLADIAIVWNGVQHFYPYFDTLSIDWHQALRDALAAVAEAQQESEFSFTLGRLVALLNDGHAGAWHGDPQVVFTPALKWDLVENQAVVVAAQSKEVGGIRRGDVVLRIDGQPVESVLAAPDNTAGGTPAYRRFVALQNALVGDYDSVLRLEIRSQDGTVRTVSVQRRTLFSGSLQMLEPRPKLAVTTLQKGIVYVDLARLTRGTLDGAINQLLMAKGIVVDGRGYPSDMLATIKFFSLLSKTPLHTAPLLAPIVTAPDRQSMTYRDDSWEIDRYGFQLGAKLVWLINPNMTISRAELFLAIAEAYHLGPLVGTHTAGTNGNLARLDLPGDYHVIWTGERVTKHDGSPLMHVGILPTVQAERTIAGVRAGKDEVLQQGLRVLKGLLKRRT